MISERGSATVELALALPAFLLVVATALWGLAATTIHLTCVDAARSGARAAARGEALDEVRAQVLRAAPPDTIVTLTRDDTTTRLTVTSRFRPPTRLPLPAITFAVDAEAVTEPPAEGPLP